MKTEMAAKLLRHTAAETARAMATATPAYGIEAPKAPTMTAARRTASAVPKTTRAAKSLSACVLHGPVRHDETRAAAPLAAPNATAIRAAAIPIGIAFPNAPQKVPAATAATAIAAIA